MARPTLTIGAEGELNLGAGNYVHSDIAWVGGVTAAGTSDPGVSILYQEGDMVYHNNALWVANIENDNVEPGGSFDLLGPPDPDINSYWTLLTSNTTLFSLANANDQRIALGTNLVFLASPGFNGIFIPTTTEDQLRDILGIFQIQGAATAPIASFNAPQALTTSFALTGIDRNNALVNIVVPDPDDDPGVRPYNLPSGATIQVNSNFIQILNAGFPIGSTTTSPIRGLVVQSDEVVSSDSIRIEPLLPVRGFVDDAGTIALTVADNSLQSRHIQDQAVSATDVNLDVATFDELENLTQFRTREVQRVTLTGDRVNTPSVFTGEEIIRLRVPVDFNSGRTEMSAPAATIGRGDVTGLNVNITRQFASDAQESYIVATTFDLLSRVGIGFLPSERDTPSDILRDFDNATLLDDASWTSFNSFVIKAVSTAAATSTANAYRALGDDQRVVLAYVDDNDWASYRVTADVRQQGVYVSFVVEEMLNSRGVFNFQSDLYLTGQRSPLESRVPGQFSLDVDRFNYAFNDENFGPGANLGLTNVQFPENLDATEALNFIADAAVTRWGTRVDGDADAPTITRRPVVAGNINDPFATTHVDLHTAYIPTARRIIRYNAFAALSISGAQPEAPVPVTSITVGATTLGPYTGLRMTYEQINSNDIRFTFVGDNTVVTQAQQQFNSAILADVTPRTATFLNGTDTQFAVTVPTQLGIPVGGLVVDTAVVDAQFSLVGENPVIRDQQGNVLSPIQLEVNNNEVGASIITGVNPTGDLEGRVQSLILQDNTDIDAITRFVQEVFATHDVSRTERRRGVVRGVEWVLDSPVDNADGSRTFQFSTVRPETANDFWSFTIDHHETQDEDGLFQFSETERVSSTGGIPIVGLTGDSPHDNGLITTVPSYPAIPDHVTFADYSLRVRQNGTVDWVIETQANTSNVVWTPGADYPIEAIVSYHDTFYIANTAVRLIGAGTADPTDDVDLRQIAPGTTPAGNVANPWNLVDFSQNQGETLVLNIREVPNTTETYRFYGQLPPTTSLVLADNNEVETTSGLSSIEISPNGDLNFVGSDPTQNRRVSFSSVAQRLSSLTLNDLADVSLLSTNEPVTFLERDVALSPDLPGVPEGFEFDWELDVFLDGTPQRSREIIFAIDPTSLPTGQTIPADGQLMEFEFAGTTYQGSITSPSVTGTVRVEIDASGRADDESSEWGQLLRVAAARPNTYELGVSFVGEDGTGVIYGQLADLSNPRFIEPAVDYQQTAVLGWPGEERPADLPPRDAVPLSNLAQSQVDDLLADGSISASKLTTLAYDPTRTYGVGDIVTTQITDGSLAEQTLFVAQERIPTGTPPAPTVVDINAATPDVEIQYQNTVARGPHYIVSFPRLFEPNLYPDTVYTVRFFNDAENPNAPERFVSFFGHNVFSDIDGGPNNPNTWSIRFRDLIRTGYNVAPASGIAAGTGGLIATQYMTDGSDVWYPMSKQSFNDRQIDLTEARREARTLLQEDPNVISFDDGGVPDVVDAATFSALDGTFVRSIDTDDTTGYFAEFTTAENTLRFVVLTSSWQTRTFNEGEIVFLEVGADATNSIRLKGRISTITLAGMDETQGNLTEVRIALDAASTRLFVDTPVTPAQAGLSGTGFLYNTSFLNPITSELFYYFGADVIRLLHPSIAPSIQQPSGQGLDLIAPVIYNSTRGRIEPSASPFGNPIGLRDQLPTQQYMADGQAAHGRMVLYTGKPFGYGYRNIYLAFADTNLFTGRIVRPTQGQALAAYGPGTFEIETYHFDGVLQGDQDISSAFFAPNCTGY